MKNLLFGFGFIIVYRLIDSVVSYFQITKYEEEYKDYIFALASGSKYSGNFREHKKSIIRLFDKVKINHPNFPNTQPTGYGMLCNNMFDAFENMHVNDERIAASMLNSFDTAKGEFKNRIFQCFNPLHWIETVIFLPKIVIEYLGFKENTVFTRILQLIWWIATFLYGVYNTEINNIIKEFIDSLIK